MNLTVTPSLAIPISGQMSAQITLPRLPIEIVLQILAYVDHQTLRNFEQALMGTRDISVYSLEEKEQLIQGGRSWERAFLIRSLYTQTIFPEAPNISHPFVFFEMAKMNREFTKDLPLSLEALYSFQLNILKADPQDMQALAKVIYVAADTEQDDILEFSLEAISNLGNVDEGDKVEQIGSVLCSLLGATNTEIKNLHIVENIHKMCRAVCKKRKQIHGSIGSEILHRIEEQIKDHLNMPLSQSKEFYIMLIEQYPYLFAWNAYAIILKAIEESWTDLTDLILSKKPYLFNVTGLFKKILLKMKIEDLSQWVEQLPWHSRTFNELKILYRDLIETQFNGNPHLTQQALEKFKILLNSSHFKSLNTFECGTLFSECLNRDQSSQFLKAFLSSSLITKVSSLHALKSIFLMLKPYETVGTEADQIAKQLQARLQNELQWILASELSLNPSLEDLSNVLWLTNNNHGKKFSFKQTGSLLVGAIRHYRFKLALYLTSLFLIIPLHWCLRFLHSLIYKDAAER